MQLQAFQITSFAATGTCYLKRSIVSSCMPCCKPDILIRKGDTNTDLEGHVIAYCCTLHLPRMNLSRFTFPMTNDESVMIHPLRPRPRLSRLSLYDQGSVRHTSHLYLLFWGWGLLMQGYLYILYLHRVYFPNYGCLEGFLFVVLLKSSECYRPRQVPPAPASLFPTP